MTDALQRRSLLVYLLLAALIVVAYSPIRHAGFVSYDDPLYITGNFHLRQGLTVQGVAWALTTPLDQWMPVTWLARLLEYQWFGLDAGAHHLINVLLHIANTLLLFNILKRMTNAPWRSALVAALFALHPLHVEPVAWVTGLKDVLSTYLALLTIWAYVRYTERFTVHGSRSTVDSLQSGSFPAAPPIAHRPSPTASYGLTLVFFTLALMAKPMVVTLPFVLLLLDFWPLGRTRWVPPATGKSVVTTQSRLFREKLPFFALAAASCVVTYWAQRGLGAVVSLENLPFGMRIGNALLCYVRYLGKTFWPTDLVFFYPLPPTLPVATAVGAGMALLGVTAVVIWQARRAPWLVTGWFWYLGTLVPVIGLVRVGGQTMADRYTYIPLIGLFIMLCWSVPYRAFEQRIGKMITCVGAGVVVAICVGLTKVQVGYWRDTDALLHHALNVNRENWLAHYNLGGHLRRLGRLQEAVDHYEQAVRIKPDFAGAQNNLGSALAELGRTQEAIGHWEQALRIKPDYAEAHYNLGVALAELGRVQDAAGHWNQALQADPHYPEAHYNLGLVSEQMGKLQEAIQHYEQALRIKPDYVEAQKRLVALRARLHRVQ